MAMSDPAIAELVEPARDAAVGALLEAMARAIESGAEVVPEPEIRDARGTVTRGGPLMLPRREDLAVTEGGHCRLRHAEGAPPGPGDCVALATEAGFVAEVAPFRWDAAELTVLTRAGEPDWAPLRRWFLEWFQTRHGAEAPDLYGAVHSLEGPSQSGASWRFTLDFGSAPVECIGDLIEAVAASGAARMRLA